MAETISTTGELQRAAGPGPTPPRGRTAAAFRALRHRNFQLFFSGQLISLVGTWIQMVAQYWLVYRLTGSTLLLGTLGFVSQIPIFLLSPVGGHVADRYPRQRIVIATQASAMVLALALAALVLTHHIRVWELLALETMLGMVNAFDIPARQSFLIEMVGREDLLNAIALNSMMFNGARVAGPAIAAVLVALIGEGWCFFANGLSYIAVIAGLVMMQVGNSPRIEETASAFEKMKEGFRFVRHTRPIRALLMLVGLLSLVAMPFTVLMPVFADKILHGGVSAYGMLMGAVGVGAVIGALLIAVRQGVQGLGKVVASAAILMGVSLILFSMSRILWLSIGILTGVGVGMMLQATSTNTLIQAMVPDQLRGRVMAVYSMMFMGMAPIGSLFAGTLAARVGAPVTVLIAGSAGVTGGLIFLRKWPSMRAGARELVEAQGMMVQHRPPDATVTPS
jgi:MFS family permease